MMTTIIWKIVMAFIMTADNGNEIAATIVGSMHTTLGNAILIARYSCKQDARVGKRFDFDFVLR